MNTKCGLRLAATVLTLFLGREARGAETDNWTYRFVPLEDSAAKLNAMVNALLEGIAARVNERLARRPEGPAAASDTEVELDFAREYDRSVLRRFGDRLLPIFDACVEANDCPGWPSFERIELRGRESIYGEGRYTKISIASLAPTIELCGVRMGADKLTHLFSNGFFYYNAGRQKGGRPRDAEEAYAMALADERGLMGARSTGVESPADARATQAGYRLASDYFQGEDPVFARGAETGLLIRRRDVDLCRYVTREFDEALDLSRLDLCRGARRVEAAIAERQAEDAWAREGLTPQDLEELREKILARPGVSLRAGLPLSYEAYLGLKWGWAYLTMPRDSRRAVKCLVFPKFSLKNRAPILLRREPAR